MKKTTIFWAHAVEKKDLMSRGLLYGGPKPLLPEMSDYNTKSGFLRCPAARQKLQNTFVVKMPYNLEIRYNSETNSIESNQQNLMISEPLYQGGLRLDFLDLEILLYCENSQMLETTPAYLKSSTFQNLGHAPTGTFNINKWFRPSSPNFSTYANIKHFTAQKDEHLMYYYFPNEKPVELRQFVATDVLLNYATSCSKLKTKLPNQTLSELYARFHATKLVKVLEKEIHNNLL